MENKIGSIVLATDQGLGYLAKDFYDNGLIHKVFIHPHSSRQNHYNWYPNSAKNIDELLEGIDTLLLFETAFDWKVIPKAREKGIKTVLMVMYECTPRPMPYQPDIILNPSLLDQKFYPEGIFIPVPVKANWRLRTEAKVFVHNAGNGGLGGRNGTRELIEAMKYVKSPIRLLIRSQVNIPGIKDERVKLHIGTFLKEEIWNAGDVFIFPEKFNGLSLPIQEAFASGMLVMCGDRFPMNTWLPKEPLIPVQYYKKERVAVEFDSAVFSPQDIAKTIDDWYGKDITSFSEKGKEYGVKNSWSELVPQYARILNNERNT